MSMKPLEFDRRYGELDQVISAYAGLAADDTPDSPGRALTAYLRHTWHTRPWALSVAEQQLRTYAQNPPGRLRQRLGEFYPVPDIGLPEAGIQQWLLLLADHIKGSVEEGQVPPPRGAARDALGVARTLPRARPVPGRVVLPGHARRVRGPRGRGP